MKHRLDAASRQTYPFLTLRFLVSWLLAGVLFLSSCKKERQSGPASRIRDITRELVSAARTASRGRAEVDTRPVYTPPKPDEAQSLAYDHVYITVPSTKTGAPDRATVDAIEGELTRVAQRHHLQRVERIESPGLERFDYLQDGHRTQSIHLITALPRAETPAAAAGYPRLAIVIDDLGSDRAQAEALFHLAYPLTVSVLPHETNSGDIAEEAHRRGYQVMLHLPVASNAGAKDEPIELRPGMNSAAVETTFAAMLETVPYASGVNNHEGSLGTSDPALMAELMPLLRQRNLFFIDSRTTAATVAEAAAHKAGVRAAPRNVFLDDEQSAPAIRKQFELALRDAREKHSALAIGHPHPETLQVLNEMLPEAQKQGVRLVFASDLAR